MLCGLQVHAYGFSMRDQRFAIRNTLVQTGNLIMIGNIVQQLFVIIVPSLILCYMVSNNTHALLPSKKSKIFQESVQFRLPLKIYILIDHQKLTKLQFSNKLWIDRNNLKIMSFGTQLLFMQKAALQTANIWLISKKVVLFLSEASGQRYTSGIATSNLDVLVLSMGFLITF